MQGMDEGRKKNCCFRIIEKKLFSPPEGGKEPFLPMKE